MQSTPITHYPEPTLTIASKRRYPDTLATQKIKLNSQSSTHVCMSLHQNK
jgi:hypothetical protein